MFGSKFRQKGAAYTRVFTVPPLAYTHLGVGRKGGAKNVRGDLSPTSPLLKPIAFLITEYLY